MAFRGGEFLITGSATSITTALSITDRAKKHVKQIHLRAIGAADIFFGPSTLTTTANRAGKTAPADTGPVILSGQGSISTDDVFVVGTAGAGNIVLISLLD